MRIVKIKRVGQSSCILPIHVKEVIIEKSQRAYMGETKNWGNFVASKMAVR